MHFLDFWRVSKKQELQELFSSHWLFRSIEIIFCPKGAVPEPVETVNEVNYFVKIPLGCWLESITDISLTNLTVRATDVKRSNVTFAYVNIFNELIVAMYISC